MLLIPTLAFRGALVSTSERLDRNGPDGATDDRLDDRLDDPLHELRRLEAMGFEHVMACAAIDASWDDTADAALTQLLATSVLPVDADVVAEDDDRVLELIARGAHRVVAGPRALRELSWLESLAAREPGRVALALALRGRRLRARGAKPDAARDAHAFLADFDSLPLGAVLVAAESLSGGELHAIEDLVAVLEAPVMVAAPVGSVQDLRNLESAGAYGAVLNPRSLPEELKILAVLEEFAA